MPTTTSDYAKAYLILYSQEYKKNPKLDTTTFNKWLHDTHMANVKVARAQYDVKGKK